MLKYILLSIFLYSGLFATDIDKKIQMLKSAPKEQRFKLMNEIKQELAKLNESQRQQMMQKLFKHKAETTKGLHKNHRFEQEQNCKKSNEQKYLQLHKNKENIFHDNKQENNMHDAQEQNKHRTGKHKNR